MKKNVLAVCIIAACFLGLVFDAAADVNVKGYRRKDGTYVRPHHRSDPDGNFWNNWSTIGNVNPYTGEPGTRRTPPSNSSPSRSSRPDYGSQTSRPAASSQSVRPAPATDRDLGLHLGGTGRGRLDGNAGEDDGFPLRAPVEPRETELKQPEDDKAAEAENIQVDRLTLMRSTHRYQVFQPESDDKRKAYEAAQRAAQSRYTQLVREEARDRRLQANGYSYELYPNRP